MGKLNNILLGNNLFYSPSFFINLKQSKQSWVVGDLSTSSTLKHSKTGSGFISEIYPSDGVRIRILIDNSYSIYLKQKVPFTAQHRGELIFGRFNYTTGNSSSFTEKSDIINNTLYNMLSETTAPNINYDSASSITYPFLLKFNTSLKIYLYKDSTYTKPTSGTAANNTDYINTDIIYYYY